MSYPLLVAPRIESLLLDQLRKAHPDVTIATAYREMSPPYTLAVLVGEPQGKQHMLSQYVRVRLSVRCVRKDGTGDWQQAQRLSQDIIRTIGRIAQSTPQILSIELDSGPIVLGDSEPQYAYSVLLATVACS